MTAMMGMNDEEVFLISLSIVASAAVAGGIVMALYKGRARKLKVLEDALQSSTVDPETKRHLVAELGRGPLARLLAGGRLLVAIGWIVFFVGIGYFFSGQYDSQIGVQIGLIGFGILSLPFVQRELDAKRQVGSRRS